jgi:hypothetical protein
VSGAAAEFSTRGLVFGLKQAAIPLATMLCGVSMPAIAVTLGGSASTPGAGPGR